MYIKRKMLAKRVISSRKNLPTSNAMENQGAQRRTCFRFLTMDRILNQVGENIHGGALNYYELI
jgi:hypothetical protein